MLQVGNAVIRKTSGRRWFGAGRPACPDSGLDLEPDAELFSSLTADYQGAADKVLAGSAEFIKLLAVPVGNIMAEVPDDESVHKDSDSRRVVRRLYQDCGQGAVGRMTPRSGRGRGLAQRSLEAASAYDGCDLGATAPAVHETMVVVSQMRQARIFKIRFGSPQATGPLATPVSTPGICGAAHTTDHAPRVAADGRGEAEVFRIMPQKHAKPSWPVVTQPAPGITPVRAIGIR